MKSIKQNTFYRGNDDELLFLKEKASELLFEINSAHPRQRREVHVNLLPKLFKKLGHLV